MSVKAKIAAIEMVGDEVRLAVVKTGGRQPKVLELHACRAVYEENAAALLSDADVVPDADQQRFDAMVTAVEAVVNKMRTRPNTYVLSVPGSNCITRTLTVPFKGKSRVAAAVPFELEPYLAFPIEELIVDFITVQEVEGETEVLTVGMRQEFLSEQLAILEAAGISPEGIGIDGIGLTSLWHSGMRRPKGLHAVLHMRANSAAFAVIDGKNLAYFRHIPVSVSEFRGNAMVLVRQVQNSIRAFQAGWRGEEDIAELTVTGGDLFEDEHGLLEQELHMPVRQESLFDGLKGAQKAHEAAMAAYASPVASGVGTPEAVEHAGRDAIEKTNFWTAAIGVAAGATGGAYAFNFRKDELAWPNAQRGVATHILFSSCLALLVLVGIAWHYHEEGKKNIEQTHQLQARVDEINVEIEEMVESGIDIDLEIFNDPPFLDVLAEIGQRMPDSKVHITSITASEILRSGADKPWITINGEVDSVDVLAEVFDDLKQSSMLRIEEEYKYNMKGGVTTFSMQLKRPETVLDSEPDTEQ